MRLEDLKMDNEAFKVAYDKALDSFLIHEDKVVNDKLLVAINMREPSYRKRLYLIDLENDKLISAHHVAHGQGSSNPKDRAYANKFSNMEGSHMSSLGAMVTTTTYMGKHGYSLKLKGLTPGINDNVERRSIVIHEADYVSNGYILKNGRAGQSFGCPAVDGWVAQGLIDRIKQGVFVYVYY